jgi:hypothetical protein
MSEFAYFRFLSAKMLTPDEERDKDEIISLTEQVLDARGLECDARIAKVPEEELRKILEQVRRLRRRKKRKNVISDDDGGLVGELVRIYEEHDKKEEVVTAGGR